MRYDFPKPLWRLSFGKSYLIPPVGNLTKMTSFSDLGAIALQGVRRATPTLGESFVVIGLGILGQLTVQMLKANGCRVIGTDIDKDRIQTAKELGMAVGIHPAEDNDIEQVIRLTDGIGADGVIITAATASDEVVSTAFNMCRKKGRVVLVGDVGLHLNREDFYQKELDFFISTSYGPGRYDNIYEEQGLDYPVAYVRWTENRNMAEYLRLIADAKLNIQTLIAKTYPLEQAPQAYESLKDSSAKPLMVLLSYPQDTELKRTIPNPQASAAGKGKIRIAIIGAGGFAKGMHLPNLQTLSEDYHIQAIVSRTGHNANATAKQFKANYASTDYQQVLNDKEVDVVLIATRHNLHADMTLQALKAGKHVLVEKPLAINRDELQKIVAFYENSEPSTPILLTGFNRRFSPYARRIQEITKNRSNPMILNYRMNAGYIPLEHWVHTEEGGGRNIGEACHIYDLFTYFTGSKVIDVTAHAITPKTNHYSRHDNFVATMYFEDGSVATLTYTALGSNKYPKEQMEVYVDGKVLVMNDYQKLDIVGVKAKGIAQSKTMDKGQKQELEMFAKAIKQGGEWAIPLWQQVQAMEIAFEVQKLIKYTLTKIYLGHPLSYISGHSTTLNSTRRSMASWALSVPEPTIFSLKPLPIAFDFCMTSKKLFCKSCRILLARCKDNLSLYSAPPVRLL
ncbi:oxidoreductase domain-containing protein [Candidatus Thiomargarita nelsonii]|uniref:Oxidoreductase domain-containing protein n=1 Tax=Candidatus Thiomargarita nelsonii TaxID=1003181 RepID=A0A176RYP3_9GAMM|nr:oxidoreductase domain-containing protein [Candidatus Thiomargarita nelsonii]